jgi:F-type H+-transporting ATPase subunit b
MAEVTQTVAHSVAHSIPEQEPTALWFGPGGWVALAMLFVFALAIWKKVPAAIARGLDAKIAQIRDQLAEAEALRKDAYALKAEYEAKAKAATSDAEAILERAHHEAVTIVAKAKDDANNLIKRRQRMAEDKIAAEERSAIAAVRAMTAKAAAAAATKLIAERHDAGSDKALVDQAIAALGSR